MDTLSQTGHCIDRKSGFAREERTHATKGVCDFHILLGLAKDTVPGRVFTGQVRQRVKPSRPARI